MTEENVTKKIIKYLKQNGWEIIAYDFPQSGTGVMILPDNNTSSKNKDSIIPDIIAYKQEICVFFENKDRFMKADFYKINSLITNNKYKNNIQKLIADYDVKNIYYGIGLPYNVNQYKIKENLELVNFVLIVEENHEIKLLYDKYSVFK